MIVQLLQDLSVSQSLVTVPTSIQPFIIYNDNGYQKDPSPASVYDERPANGQFQVLFSLIAPLDYLSGVYHVSFTITDVRRGIFERLLPGANAFCCKIFACGRQHVRAELGRGFVNKEKELATTNINLSVSISRGPHRFLRGRRRLWVYRPAQSTRWRPK